MKGVITTMSLYDNQRNQIKEIILSTSIELFKERGYENTSISEITKKVEIAKGTFYNYFTSKKEVLFTWTGRIFNELDFSKALSKSNTVRENLYNLIDITCEPILLYKKLYLAFFNEILSAQITQAHTGDTELTDLIRTVITNSKDSEEINDEDLDRKINIMDNCLFMGIIEWYNRHKMDSALEDHLRKIIDMCLYGIYKR